MNCKNHQNGLCIIGSLSLARVIIFLRPGWIEMFFNQAACYHRGWGKGKKQRERPCHQYISIPWQEHDAGFKKHPQTTHLKNIMSSAQLPGFPFHPVHFPGTSQTTGWKRIDDLQRQATAPGLEWKILSHVTGDDSLPHILSKEVKLDFHGHFQVQTKADQLGTCGSQAQQNGEIYIYIFVKKEKRENMNKWHRDRW